MDSDTRLMNNVQIDHPFIGQIVNIICKVANPEKIILFGSVGRGDPQKDSDIDLLIIKSGFYDPISLAGDIYVRLHGIKQSVDIIISSPEELDTQKNIFGSVFYPAVREGRVIYETKAST